LFLHQGQLLLQQLLERVGGRAATGASHVLTPRRWLAGNCWLHGHAGYFGKASLLNLSPLLVVHILRLPWDAPQDVLNALLGCRIRPWGQQLAQASSGFWAGTKGHIPLLVRHLLSARGQIPQDSSDALPQRPIGHVAHRRGQRLFSKHLGQAFPHFRARSNSYPHLLGRHLA
jgi:hypothetical protein